jgi:hypothetical protein
MTSEDKSQSTRHWLPVLAGLAGVFVASSLLGLVLLTGDDESGVAPPKSPQSSTALRSTSTTRNTRIQVVERLREILRIRDEAFRERNPEILQDVYTTDCPCLAGDRNAIKELTDNNYHVVGGTTSIQVQKASQVNGKLWLVVADFQSAPLRIETKDRRLIREEPRGSDLFQFALSRPFGSSDWLLGRATEYQDAG